MHFWFMVQAMSSIDLTTLKCPHLEQDAKVSCTIQWSHNQIAKGLKKKLTLWSRGERQSISFMMYSDASIQ